MILRIAADVFESPSEGETLSLLELIFHDQSRAHGPILRLWPEHEELNDRGAFRRWLGHLGDRGPEVLALFNLGAVRESMLSVVQPSYAVGVGRRSRMLDVRVESRPHSDWPALRLTVADALELVKEPIHLRLEDEYNDMAFVCWLAPPTTRDDLRVLLRDAGRVHTHGGGTGTIGRWLGRLEDEPVLQPDEQRRLWRTWVLFDKDAGAQDARDPSKTAKSLMLTCERVVAKHHIPFTWICLQRREIESYVPDEGLRSTGSTGSAKAAKLIRQWRAHPDRQAYAWAYDMKNGLLGDLVPEITSVRRTALRSKNAGPPGGGELKEPFRGLSKDERRILERGFGGNLLNGPLHENPPPRWLLEIGNEYDRGPVHQVSRQALLQSIFDRI